MDSVVSNPDMARRIAVSTAKSFVHLCLEAGVRSIDHVQDMPQVQMTNLKTLRAITGNVHLQMERNERYTRYSALVLGVEFFFLAAKEVPEIQ